MIAADLWRMALAAVLPLLDQHILGIYAVAFGLSAGAVFFNPASASALPGIVDERELLAANSGLWSAAVIAQIALAPCPGSPSPPGAPPPPSGSTRPASPPPRSS